MLALRRLAIIQSRAAVPLVQRYHFHTAPFAAVPIPTSTDSANRMSSTNTAGQGPNEPGNPNTVGSGAFGSAFDPYARASGDMEDIKSGVKRKAKTAATKAKAAASDMAEGVRHAGAKAKIGAASVKEDVKHEMNRSYTTQSRQTNTDSSTNMNVSGVKAQAKDAAHSAADAVKSGAASVKDTVLSMAGKVKDATSTMTDKIKDTKGHAAERATKLGHRLEARLEKLGENLQKSGEEIERRNQDPDNKYPEPNRWSAERLHEPNPKNLNDVLPGTGPKDQRKNTPITDSVGRGQFPG